MSRILLLMGVVVVSACQKGVATVSRTVVYDTGMAGDELDADATSPLDEEGESPIDTGTSPQDSGSDDTASGSDDTASVDTASGSDDTASADTASGSDDTATVDTAVEDEGELDTGMIDTGGPVVEPEDSGVSDPTDSADSGGDVDGTDLGSDDDADAGLDDGTDVDSDDGTDVDSDDDPGADSDGDGGVVVDDGPGIGDIFVTEIMANPDSVSDLDGEWFELYNPGATPFSLRGCRFSSDDGDEFTVDEDVTIPPWGRLVFGVNADETENGGAAVDYAYNRLGFDLDNGADRIRIENAAGIVVSSVAYTDEWEQEAGYSMQLDSSVHYIGAASEGSNWCVSGNPMSGGDFGTPHTPNELCGVVDHDGDGFIPATGDCDDDDAAVGPGQPERWDGVDNNCDGLVDNFSESTATTHIEGRDSDFLGWYSALSTGDITGDGRTDLLAGGSWVLTGGDGGIWMLDGQYASDWSGSIADWSTAVIEGSDDSSYFATMSPRMGDQNSDGADDVLVLGTDGFYPSALYGVYAGSLFYGGSDLTGSWVESEADVLFEASVATYWYVTALADVDFDADGHDDIFLGNYFASALSRGDVFFFSGDDLVSDSIVDVVDDAGWHVQGNAAGDFLGYSLAAADMNDDGHVDLISGAAAESYDGVERAGCVYMMPGGPIDSGSGATVAVSSAASFKVCGNEPHARLGRHAAAQLFDVNGDDTQDLVLSASGADSGGSEGNGKAFIFFNDGELSGTTTVADADVTLSGGASDYFGYAMHHGDFDGDGENELAVGAPDTDSYDDALEGPGEVFLYRTSTLAMGGSIAPSSADLRLTGAGFSGFGSAINSADFDGNGIDELIVASHRWNVEMGRVSLFSLN